MAILAHLLGHEAVAKMSKAELDRLSAVIDQQTLTNPEYMKLLAPTVQETYATMRGMPKKDK